MEDKVKGKTASYCGNPVRVLSEPADDGFVTIKYLVDVWNDTGTIVAKKDEKRSCMLSSLQFI